MITCSVNSEANARRIAMVESCFGGSGQVSSISIIVREFNVK